MQSSRTGSDSPFARAAWRRLALAWASVAILATGCAAIPGPLGTGERTCIPDFQYAEGWLGGDGVFSIPVPTGQDDHETIWLFGDTYVGAPGARDRDGAALIHNSVGVSRCRSDDAFEIEYSWRADDADRPAAVFTTDRARHFVWPFDGFFLGERLYVVLVEVRPSSTRGPLGLPFVVTRTLLARVENPDAPPAYWRVEQRALTSDGQPVLSGGVYVERGWVHMMATPSPETIEQPRFLVRLPVEGIEDWSDDIATRLETFTHRGGWEPGLHAENARILLPDSASEMTIDRIGDTGLYFVVYGSPTQTSGSGTASDTPRLDANSIFVRTATSLTGPWSKRQRLYLMPEAFEPPRDARRGRRFCYASKAHAALSPEGILLMTYVCNLAPGTDGDMWATLDVMKTRMDLYRPRVVAHPWPLHGAFELDGGSRSDD